MTSSEARDVIANAPTNKATLDERERKWELIDADLRHRDSLIGPRPRDGFERYQRDLIVEARRMVLDGIVDGDTFGGGVPFPELMSSMRGQPGLLRTRAALAALPVLLEAAKQVLARWPTEDTTHRYRYAGPMWKAQFDGRYLEPGDVVELTEARAAAWADRFEAVEETIAS